MAVKWYYVENDGKAGPVDEATIASFLQNGSLNEKSYVWKKGFDDWVQIVNVPELHKFFEEDEMEEEFDDKPFYEEELVLEDEEDEESELVVGEITQTMDVNDFIHEDFADEQDVEIDWDSISATQPIFSIKVGHDRGSTEVEYGPFSLDALKKLFTENRINGRTYIFTPQMNDWIFLADLPIYEKIFAAIPPVIDDGERRINVRRPFVAKMFFHNNSQLFEGVCRDISVGGLQVLVFNPPVNEGERISMNVHPENSEYSFVASGKVVRLLSGGQGFSLRFMNLSDEAQTAITGYLERT